MPDFYHLGVAISCHAWNADRTKLAFCPDNNEIHIYSGCQNSDKSKWVREHVLAEHDMTVSGLDWSGATNKIVSCSHDRNAFVWTYEEPTKTWKPSLVILRINRAALSVKWSHDGQKFAVASGAKCVPVCLYDPENDWWVSKMIKKHKSTVLTVAWHPSNNQLLATGSTDFKCRIFSAFLEETDHNGPNPSPLPQMGAFGDVMAEFECNGWVEGVAWSNDGDQLAYTGHNSSLNVVALNTSSPEVFTLRHQFQPFVQLGFTSESTIVGVGHDFNPILFTKSGDSWAFTSKLDTGKTETNRKSDSAFSAARNIFHSKTMQGRAEDKGSGLFTTHEATITCLTSMTPGADMTKFSTSGMDGRLVIWDV